MSGRHSVPTARTGTGDRVLTAILILTLGLVMALGYGLIDNRWYRVLSVAGGSMEPAIDRGDAIVLIRPPEILAVGDIITLQANDTLVTHRVVAVDADGSFQTKGDANDAVDDWTGVDVRVVGRVLVSIPWLGSALAAFDSSAFFHDASSRPAEVLSGAWGSPVSETDDATVRGDIPASTATPVTSQTTVAGDGTGDTIGDTDETIAADTTAP